MLINAPERPTYLFTNTGVLHAKSGFFDATRMTMTRLLASDAGEIDTFLGGGYLVDGGLTGLLNNRERVIALVQPCHGDLELRMRERLNALGFIERSRQPIGQAAQDRVVIQRGETVIALFDNPIAR